ncbi:MAG: hypothetical protein ACI9K5_003414, partial [Gammaproteobacteria bacterium]
MVRIWGSLSSPLKNSNSSLGPHKSPGCVVGTTRV